METAAFPLETIHDLSGSLDDVAGTTRQGQRANVLSNRLTSILSASYSDAEIRDALRTLDGSNLQSNSEVRRRLRFDVQKEVIDCNADIINEFGAVAQVRWKYCDFYSSC